MKIKSIKANIHQVHARVPLLKHPLRRKIVFCEVETDDGHKGYGLTGGAYLPMAIVTALNKEFLPGNNIVKIPTTPGLGLTPNFDALKDSRIAE